MANKDIALLMEALGNDIIDLDSVRDALMATKREEVRKKHPYALTPPSKEGGRWQTRYRKPDGSYTSIRGKSEEEVLDKLIPYYFPKTNIDKMTFFDLFKEWLVYKEKITESDNTILRHEQHYAKYFAPNPIHTKKIRSLDTLELQSICNGIVKEFNITKKEWTNVKTVLSGMFEYAEKKQYLQENLMKDVTIYVKFRQVAKKPGSKETFSPQELKELLKYLENQYIETNDVAFLAWQVNFGLGLRVGELAALKWSDLCEYDGLPHLHVTNAEIYDKRAKRYYVAPHTKTHEDRYVPIPTQILSIIEKIRQRGDDSEYMFIRNGERLRSNQLNYVLEKYAERNGLTMKRSHKTRKSYASYLYGNGISLEVVRGFLGHKSLATTENYIFNPLTTEDTYASVNVALQNVI